MSLYKSNLYKTHMEQSVDSNLSKKFKAIASLPIPYFAHISDFILKKGFLQKPSKPGHGNLVLITSAVQLYYNIRSFKDCVNK